MKLKNVRPRISALLLAGALAATCLTACGGDGGSDSGGTIKIRMQTTAPENDPWTTTAQRFADTVEKESGGKIKVEVYCCGQLAQDTVAELEAVKSGQLGATLAFSAVVGGIEPKALALSLPFLANDPEQLYELLDGPADPVMVQALKDSYGLVGIPKASMIQGFRQVTTSDKEITAPSDFKGLQIRAPQIEMYADTFKALGADPISLPFSDLANALQTGGVDGQENPLPLIETSGIGKLQKHLALLDWSVGSLQFAFNEELWSSLDAEQQKLVTDAAIEAAQWNRGQYEETEDASLAKLEDELTVRDFTAEDKQPFRDAVQSVYDKWTPKIGADIVSAYEAVTGSGQD